MDMRRYMLAGSYLRNHSNVDAPVQLSLPVESFNRGSFVPGVRILFTFLYIHFPQRRRTISVDPVPPLLPSQPALH